MKNRMVGSVVKGICATLILVGSVAGGIVISAGVAAAATPTTTVLTASPNPAIVGQPVTLTATITPATGTTGAVYYTGVPAGDCFIQGVTTTGGVTTSTCTYTYANTTGSPNAITAHYFDLSNTYGSSSGNLSLPVVQPTTTAVVSSVNPVGTGAPVTFTATVTSSVTGTPTGTVNFKSNGVTITGCGTQALGAPTTTTTATATCATSFATANTYPITAVYSGSGTLGTSTSPALSQVVYTTTTTTLASSANPSVTGQPVTYTATVSPTPTGGTVNFKDGATTITGCGTQTVTAGHATCVVSAGYAASGGSHSITAVYSGVVGFTGSTSAVLTQAVNKGATGTVTTLSAGPNPSVTGQPVSFTATVSVTSPAVGSPTGTVGFTDGGNPIAGCTAVALTGATAVCPTTLDAANGATQSIVATYSGDTNFLTSVSPGLSQTVNKGATTTTVTSNNNPSVTGQSVTFTATVAVTSPAVGAPGGTVAFTNDLVTIPGCAAAPVTAGVATCTTTFDAKNGAVASIVGTYSGNSSFAGSTSSPFAQTVNKGVTGTVTTLTAGTNPTVTGASVTYTATVSPQSPALGAPSGTVLFKSDGTAIPGCAAVTLVSDVATCTTSFDAANGASHVIVAVYSGDNSFTGSTSPNLTQTVNKGATSTAVTSNNNPSVTGQPVTFTATVSVTSPASGTPTGTVGFTAGGNPIAGCTAVALTGTTATCPTTFDGANGNQTIVATYSGDNSFTGSTSPNLIQTVNKGATGTVTTLTAGTNPSVTGQSLTYTATVSPVSPAAGNPTGTVSFTSDSNPIATCTSVALVSDVATCTTSFDAANGASHVIVAVYSGDNSFTGSTSPTYTQTVNKGATSVVVTADNNPSVTGQDVTYTATIAVTTPASGTPTGTVDFTSDGNSIGCDSVTLSGLTATCTTSFDSADGSSHAIEATYSGDDSFNGSNDTITQTVNPGDTGTVTTLTSGTNPSRTGQSVTFTATVSPVSPASGNPTGTVDFTSDGNSIGCDSVTLTGDVATCTVSFDAADGSSHAIVATYSGDDSFNGSTAETYTQDVIPGDTSTAVTVDNNPSVTGQDVTYTATIAVTTPASGTPTGTVDFTSDGNSIGCDSQPVSGATATCTTTYDSADGGSHTIVATYSGDTNFNGSTSPDYTQTVNPGDTGTVTTLTGGTNPSVTGQSVTYTATVSPVSPASGNPTGTVDFTSDGNSISCDAVTLVGDVATCTVSFNAADGSSHTIVATYSGDDSFNGSTAADYTQDVNPGDTSTAVTADNNPSVTGQSVTFTATISVTTPASGTPTGTVDFKNGGTSITGCASQPIAGDTATCTTTFAHGNGSSLSIEALYSGDTNFNGSNDTITQTVNLGPTATTTTLSAGTNPSVSGQSVTYRAAVAPVSPAAGSPTGSVAFKDGATTIAACASQGLTAGVATCTVTYPSPTGSPHAITAVYAGDVDFATSTSSALTHTVNQAGTSTVVTSSANPTPAFQNVTYTARVSATAPGSGTPTGTVAFKDGSTTIAGCGAAAVSGGVATCTTSYLGGPQTTHPITAVYSGDASFTGSTSPILNVVVNSSIDEGYWLATANGGIFTFGGATFYGSAGSLALNSPIVNTVATPDGKGYWLVAADGGIFSFGDAAFYGSTGSLHLNKPIVGMTPTADGKGYWLVASDGGIFAFGDAAFYGSTGSLTLNKPIVGMASTPDGRGYWLVASDGGIFAFGDAAFYGSTGSLTLNQPVVGMASTHDGHGYWMVAADGGIFSFGDAQFYGSAGSLHLFRPVVGMVATPSGQGYWFVASDGGVFAFGDAYFVGSIGGVQQSSPVVGLATL